MKKIAICITTRNRPKTLACALGYHEKFLPPHAKIFIVDDASDEGSQLSIVEDHTYKYYGTNIGVAAAKNACLRMAYDWGADHIFLFDDDTWPIKRGWYKPYIEHEEPHLMYQFRLPGKPTSDMITVHRGVNTVAYNKTRGAMLYIKREVLHVVGGMDTAYGLAMYEHTDWTNRIHNAGLTKYRAMDVPYSDQLIYCMDQDMKIKSSIPNKVRRNNIIRNHHLYRKSKLSKEFKDF